MPLIEEPTKPHSAQPVETLQGLKESFPFSSIRPAQVSGLELIARAHDSSKQFTIIEAPTGSGKSGLGMAPAIFSANSKKDGGAHYLTSQKSLSAQLTRDFGSHGLVELRGAQNYQCIEQDANCKDGALAHGGRQCEGCPYRSAKNAYVNGKLGVTNYSYYLTETMHAGELAPRDYMIADEGHNIEREILALVNITINQSKANEVNAERVPVFGENEDAKVRRWLQEQYIPNARKYLNFLNQEIEEMRNSGQRIPAAVQSRTSNLKQTLGNLSLYIEADDPNEWLAWSDNNGSLCIKPLTAAEFAQNYLFQGTPNVVILSATILDFDTFRHNLGIRKSDSTTMAVPSDFPVGNRKIVYWPVGSMSSKTLEQSLPRIAERTDAILNAAKFRNVKGIIHTHSYKINSYLNNALDRIGNNGSRLITHNADPASREDAIAAHFSSAAPSILMSPSMTEGLDLKDDLSRIQIITKVPYPFLDSYNRTRMQRDPKWYQLQTALALVQATGRSVRSMDDYATTVILDQDFGRFLSQNQDILPKWWMDSIEFR